MWCHSNSLSWKLVVNNVWQPVDLWSQRLLSIWVPTSNPPPRSLVQGSLVWNYHYAITKDHDIINAVLYIRNIGDSITSFSYHFVSGSTQRVDNSLQVWFSLLLDILKYCYLISFPHYLFSHHNAAGTRDIMQITRSCMIDTFCQDELMRLNNKDCNINPTTHYVCVTCCHSDLCNDIPASATYVVRSNTATLFLATVTSLVTINNLVGRIRLPDSWLKPHKRILSNLTLPYISFVIKWDVKPHKRISNLTLPYNSIRHETWCEDHCEIKIN